MIPKELIPNKSKCVFKTFEHLRWSFLAKMVNGLKPLTIFTKKGPSLMFIWVLNKPLKRYAKMLITIFLYFDVNTLKGCYACSFFLLAK